MMNDEMIKSLRAEYYRDWRKKNPEKVRKINERYWKRRAERAAEQTKQDEVKCNDTDI